MEFQRGLGQNTGDLKIAVDGRDLTIHYIEGESNQETSERLAHKLVPRERLPELSNFLKAQGLKIAYTSGAYDLVHVGHTRYLELARSLVGKHGVLVAGLNSDKSIKSYKGPDRPIVGEMFRAETLSSLEDVNYLTLYDEPTGAEVIRQLKPDFYLCVQGSWEGGIETKEEISAMAEAGGEVYYCPRQSPLLSTSRIIDKIIIAKLLRVIEEMGYPVPTSAEGIFNYTDVTKKNEE